MGRVDRRTQAERSTESRKKLIDAAIHLLATRGYAGTTLAEIGQLAGLSRGMVTHHFGTKEACVEAVVGAIHSGMLGAVQEGMGGRRGVSALDALVDVYFALLRGQSAGARAMFIVRTEAVATVPRIRELIAENNEALRRFITTRLAEGISDGEMDAQLDPDVTAVLVEGVLRGSGAQWLIDPQRVDLDAAGTALKRIFRARCP
ncbi:TetR family transcriptional regulator [Pendulispora rubella]|uniref:TetR family transcriptional regulator n=1 Tax=Pendulispora rubella TaxID=2741070 RepID=A0ABZ2LCN6_9BACT